MEDADNNLILTAGAVLGGYVVSHVLGRGSYGIVYAASAVTTPGVTVALKIVRNQPAYRRQATLEVNVLKEFSQRFANDSRRRHAVEMLHSFEYNGHICLVFTALSHTLHTEAYTQRRHKTNHARNREWTLDRVRSVCRQVLQPLSLLEHLGVMHCDVKPENVMYEGNDGETVRLIDFGSVRPLDRNDYYDVQSLWYRAPEVLQRQRYDCKVDSWSVGCMAVELFTGAPLFPGSNPADQLRRIMTLSRPESIAGYLHTHMFNDRANPTLQRTFVDFICQCLCVDPRRRLSPSEAMQHPLFLATAVKVRDPPVVPWGLIDDDGTWSPGSTSCDSDDSSTHTLEWDCLFEHGAQSNNSMITCDVMSAIPYFDSTTTAF